MMSLSTIRPPEIVKLPTANGRPGSPTTTPAAPLPSAGRANGANRTRVRFAPFARPALGNGAAGVVVGDPGRPFAVGSFTISGGRIVESDIITDPDQLPQL